MKFYVTEKIDCDIYTSKSVEFTYKKRSYYMNVHYNKVCNTTLVSIYKDNDELFLTCRLSHFAYHTKCLNVQQHINNFIIELKEKLIWKL